MQILENFYLNSETRVMFTCFIMNADGSQRRRSGPAGIVMTMAPGEKRTCFNFIKVNILRGCRNELLVADALRLEVELMLPGSAVPPAAPSMAGRLVQNMMGDQNTSNVTLITDDNTHFPVHRFVLEQRSQFFADMFADYGEDRYKVIIEGLSTPTVRKLIDFMYNFSPPAGLPSLLDLAEVMAGGDYLNLEELLQWCQVEFLAKLDDENVSDVLQLSERFGLDPLYEVSTKFIERHITSVVKTDSWKRMSTGMRSGRSDQYTLNRFIQMKVYLLFDEPDPAETDGNGEGGDDGEDSDDEDNDEQDGHNAGKRPPAKAPGGSAPINKKARTST